MCHGRVTLPRSVQITAYCSICQLSVAVVSFLRYHKNRWRESNPLMCELKRTIRLAVYQRSLSRHETNTKNMANITNWRLYKSS